MVKKNAKLIFKAFKSLKKKIAKIFISILEKRKMKKNKIFLTLALLFASISFAIPKGPCDKKEVCCVEPDPGPFAFYYPKDMNLSCPKGFYVKGEFLLMQVKEEGLEYALIQNKATIYSPYKWWRYSRILHRTSQLGLNIWLQSRHWFLFKLRLFECRSYLDLYSYK